MGLNLGLENLTETTKKEIVISAETLITMTSDVEQSLHDAQTLVEGQQNLLDVLDMLKEFGYVKGMEKIVDIAQLNELLGLNIKTASNEQIITAISNEDVFDSLNKLGAKISGAIGRVGDAISNFIKTTLPFKEKYLKNIINYKKTLAGKEKDIDAAKFAASGVMGISKDKWNETIEKRKNLLNSITEFSKITNANEDLEKFLDALSRSEISRLGGWMIAFRPWVSRVFVRGKVGTLGWTGKDVIGIIDDAIAEAESLTKTVNIITQMRSNLQAINKKISLLRASGNKEEAGELRKKTALASTFFMYVYNAVSLYEMLIRKELYFANSIGDAAVKAISK